ncbi:hypothetical protein NMG60_11021186 [Bertholletia excelsa]
MACQCCHGVTTRKMISTSTSSSPSVVLLCILLLVLGTTTASGRVHNFPILAHSVSGDGSSTLSRNNEEESGNIRQGHAAGNLKTNSFHIPPTGPSPGNKVSAFNDSVHEVPSGPNPVSNR